MNRSWGISVIIPTYNEAATIKVLLKQLFSPEIDKDIEVIIVDAAASNDKLKNQILEFPVQYVSSTHTSRAVQLNEGAKLAKHDILYFLHADAIPPSNFTQKIKESISNGFDFGYFRYEFDSKNPLLKINSYLSQFKAFYTGGGDQSCYIKKSIFEKINGFNEELNLCEDFDLFDRLKAKKYKFEIINSKLRISARKYEATNYVKVNFANYYVLRNFRKGVSTDVLRSKYNQMLGKN